MTGSLPSPEEFGEVVKQCYKEYVRELTEIDEKYEKEFRRLEEARRDEQYPDFTELVRLELRKEDDRTEAGCRLACEIARRLGLDEDSVEVETVDSWTPWSGIGFSHTHYLDRVTARLPGGLLYIAYVELNCKVVYGRVEWELVEVSVETGHEWTPPLRRLLKLLEDVPIRDAWRRLVKQFLNEMNERVVAGEDWRRVFRETSEKLDEHLWIYEVQDLKWCIEKVLADAEARAAPQA